MLNLQLKTNVSQLTIRPNWGKNDPGLKCHPMFGNLSKAWQVIVMIVDFLSIHHPFNILQLGRVCLDSLSIQHYVINQCLFKFTVHTTFYNWVVFVPKLDKIILYFYEEEHLVHVITKLLRTILVPVHVPPTHKWNRKSSSSPTLILVLKIRFAFGPVLTNLNQN